MLKNTSKSPNTEKRMHTKTSYDQFKCIITSEKSQFDNININMSFNELEVQILYQNNHIPSCLHLQIRKVMDPHDHLKREKYPYKKMNDK